MNYQRLIMAVFFLQPVAFGAWLVRIPDVQHALGLGPAGLALALLGLPTGTLITLPFAGKLASRVGARAIIFYGFIVYSAVICLPALSATPVMLFLALALCGSAISTLELGLNVKADVIEKLTGSLIMSTCHGFWSLGIMAGSLIGSGLAALGLSAQVAIPLVAIVTLPVALVASNALPHIEPEAPKPKAEGGAGFGLPGPLLLGICVFAFGITMTEGAIADWSAVFLRGEFGLGAAQAGLGYSVFALLVALGRFAGDRLKARFGAVALARGCAAFAFAGMLVTTLAPSYPFALAGFALIGIGVSTGFPLAVSAAASLTDRPAAQSVAMLSFIALLGFLIGPPIIGFVAEATDLRWGLAFLVPALMLSLLLSGMLKPAKD